MQTFYVNRNAIMPNITHFMDDMVHTMSIKSDSPSPFKNLVRRIYFDFKFAVVKKGAFPGKETDHDYQLTLLGEDVYSNVKEYSFELDMVNALTGNNTPGEVLQDILTSFCEKVYPDIGDDEQVTLIGFTPRLKKTIFAISEEYKDKMMMILSWFKSTIEKLLDRHNLISTVQSYDGQQEDAPADSESVAEAEVEVTETTIPEEIAHNLDDDFVGSESAPDKVEEPVEVTDESVEKLTDNVVTAEAPVDSPSVTEEPVEAPVDNVAVEETHESPSEEKVATVPEETSPEVPHEEVADTPVKEDTPESTAPESDTKPNDVVETPREEVTETPVTEAPAEDSATESKGNVEPSNDVVDFPFEGGTVEKEDLPCGKIDSPEQGNTDYPLRQFAVGIRKTYHSQGGVIIPLDRVVMVRMEKDVDVLQVCLEHGVDVLLKGGNAIDFLKKYRDYMNYY